MKYNLKSLKPFYCFGDKKFLNKKYYEDYQQFPIENTNFSILIETKFKCFKFTALEKLKYEHFYNEEQEEILETIVDENNNCYFQEYFSDNELIEQYFDVTKLTKNNKFVDHGEEKYDIGEYITFEITDIEQLFYHKLKHDEDIIEE